MELRELLKQNSFLILDGGMGTTLQKNGLKPGDVPELLNLERPELIASVHQDRTIPVDPRKRSFYAEAQEESF